jgi:hypothetical protein
MNKELTVDNMSDEEWLLYDEFISDGFSHDQAILMIEEIEEVTNGQVA